MKKLFLLIFSFILVNAFCFSQIRISAKTGVLASKTDEILWNKYGDDAEILSLLKWRTYAAPVLSLDTQFNISKIFFAGLKGFYTIPLSYGFIEDFDCANLLSTGSSELTHYSKHDNKLDNFYKVELFFGTEKSITEKIHLSAQVTAGFSYYSFTAQNGHKQYGEKIGKQRGYDIYTSWSPDIPESPMQGNIISFEDLNIYAGLGASLSYTPFDPFSISLFANALPVIKSSARDIHYRRNQYALFDLPFQLAFDSSLLLEYKLNKKNVLTAGFDFSALSVKEGSLFLGSDNQNWQKASNPCGIKQMTWKILLGYTYIYEK